MSDKCGIRMTQCFWCGEPDGIAIPKRLDKWADKYCAPIVVSYEPCGECKKKFAEGIHVIEVNTEPNNDGQPGLIPGSYPTGRYWVVKDGVMKDATKGDSRLILEADARRMGFYGDK